LFEAPLTVIRSLLWSRFISFAAVSALLLALIALGRHVTYEQSIQSFFADDDPAVLSYSKASAVFGNDNFVFVCYDDPALLTPAGMDRVAGLAEELGPKNIPAVVHVESLDAMPVLWEIDDRLIQFEKLPAFARKGLLLALQGLVKNLDTARGSLSVGSKVRSADEAGLEALKAKVTTHPLFVGTVIDPSGTSTAVVVRLKPMAEQEPKETVLALRARADAFARKHSLARPALVGPPVLLADGYNAIEIDGQRLAWAGMGLIGLVTLSATHSIWWAIVPLLAGWVVWLATETILATLNLKLSLSGGPLVAQIIVLTMPAASHLAIHFRDERRREPERRRASIATLEAVTAPIIWCAITGAIGYGALLTSNVVPIRQFGAVLGACTLIAAVLTLLISPIAMLPPIPLEIGVRYGSTSGVSSALNRLTGWVFRHPAPIVVGVLAVVLPVALGIFRLQNESNYINAFKPGSRVVQDYRFVESRLGGIGLVALIGPVGTGMNPPVLERLRGLEEQIKALRLDGKPAVSHVLSLATVLDPDRRLTELPAEQAADAIKTKLDLIAASPQSDLLRSFWNQQTGEARVLVRVVEQQAASTKEATFAQAERLARATLGPEAYLTGLSYLLTQTTRGVIATQWSTFFWSAAGILLMLTLAFRGPVLALLALLPTMLAVGLVLGLMGWMNIKLDIATALVASVALGLSVDDTFHCLLLFRRHSANHDRFRESLLSSYAVTGPGVLLSSLAVALGFAVLRFSEFVPFSNFGMMVCIATAGSSLGNLVLLPACLTLLHRFRAPLAQPQAAVTAKA
jgi:uncharacterized protein